ncbi:MAG: WG repeat-containing protein [Gemmatimonadota bacterium]
MQAGHGRWRALLVTLASVVVLTACNSPEDDSHRIFGYVDADGREVIAPQFLAALPFHEGLAAVNVSEGWGYIDATGHWVIQPAYLAASSFSQGRAAVRDVNGAWGYIDRSGTMVIAPRYLAAYSFIGDRAVVWLHGDRMQVLDRDGRVVAEPEITASTPSHESEAFGASAYWGFVWVGLLEEQAAAIQAERLIPFEDDDDRGRYVDPEGKLVIEGDFESPEVFFDGLARVKRDGKYGFIDREGRYVVPPKFDEALLRFSRDRTVAVHDGQAWLVDLQGRDIASLGAWRWPNLGSEEGFDDIASHVGYSDFFADGLIPWQRDGRWGYVDLDGRWVIEPQFEMAQPFHAGRASVQADGRGRLIDVHGREIASVPRGWWIAPGGGTRLMVGTATQWGFTDATGKLPGALPYATIRIKFTGLSFADARPLQFSDGLAVVSRIAPHRWQVVDTDGCERAAGRYDWLEDAGGGLYAVAIGQRWALADSRLRILSATRFDVAPGFLGTYPRATVEVNGRIGCVDRRGRWRALPGDVSYADCDSPLMTAVVRDGPRQGVLAPDGRWVIRPEYESVSRLHGKGGSCYQLTVAKVGDTEVGRIACVESGKVRYSPPRRFRCLDEEACFLRESTGWRWLDFRTMQVTGASHTDIGGISVQRQLAVRQGEHWGLMATSGQLTVPAEFDEIVWMTDRPGRWLGVLKVRRDGRWGVIAADGRVVVPVRYDEVGFLVAGLFTAREGSLWGVVREGGAVIVPARFDEILEVSGDVLLAKSGGVVHLETLSGEAVLDPSPPWLQRIYAWSDFSEGYWAAFTLDRELYFIDKRARTVHRVDPPQGRTWLDPNYEPRMSDEIVGYEAGGFKGLLYVRSPGPSSDMSDEVINAVVVDASGRLLPWLFDAAETSIDLAPRHYLVFLRGKCGVIDDRGRWSVSPEHDHCEVIEDGRLILGDEDYPRSAGAIRVSPYADARQAQVYDPVRRWAAARRGEN